MSDANWTKDRGIPDWAKSTFVLSLVAGWVLWSGGGEALWGYAICVAAIRWLWLERQWWKARKGRVVV
jgi:hypothetical protein